MNKSDCIIKKGETLEDIMVSDRFKRNMVQINTNNTIEHEFAKFLAGWLIRKDVPSSQIYDVFQQKEWKELKECVIKNVNRLEKDYSIPVENDWEREEFITEARHVDGRRVDLETLLYHKKLEFESGRSYEKTDDSVSISI